MEFITSGYSSSSGLIRSLLNSGLVIHFQERGSFWITARETHDAPLTLPVTPNPTYKIVGNDPLVERSNP